jgi:hypothetical protein
VEEIEMRPLLVLGLFCVATVASAEVYKWVDADGKVNYSDQRPAANVNARKLADPPPPSDPDAYKRMSNQQVELKKASDTDAEKRRKGEQDLQAMRQKEEFCTQARGQLQALRAGGPTFRYDGNGERQFLDESAKEEAIRDLTDKITKNCQG